VELSVIGDGEFREPMRQFLLATGLERSVHLLGALSNHEVRRHLREADLFLQHSITADNGDEEGLPVAILEAMAESVPVVATKHAGIPEVVVDGENGFLVTPGDTRGMAERGIRLLKNDALRFRLGHRAVRSIQDARRFTVERELVRLRRVLAKYWPEHLGEQHRAETPN
jgi:colanic acid/amylovoran biosynthesis glycosyltransferase